MSSSKLAGRTALVALLGLSLGLGLCLAACAGGATTAGSTGTLGTNTTTGTSSGGGSGGCTVSTLAGNGDAGPFDGTGGPNGSAAFNHPSGLAVDAAGNVYVADQFDNLIRKIDTSGNVTTIAGDGDAGFVDGAGADAGAAGRTELNQPSGVALDGLGALYVADSFNNRIRKLKSGNLTTLVGNGTFGFVDGDGGPKGSTEFAGPSGLAVDGAGKVYVADEFNDAIRKVTPAGDTSTIVGGLADGGPGPLNRPGGIAVDITGNVYIGDTSNGLIRKLDPAGNLTTLSAFQDAGALDAGPAFDTPTGVAIDSQGNLYVADSANNRIRRIDARGNITTIAGSLTPGFADGPGEAAQFSNPTGVALGADGTIFVGDSNNNRIRIVTCP